MKLSEFKNITYGKDAETGIATITINRPEIKNALTLLVLLELYWAADAVEAVTKALDIENEGLNQAIASADFWEALAARQERREPVFKGE